MDIFKNRKKTKKIKKQEKKSQKKKEQKQEKKSEQKNEVISNQSPNKHKQLVENLEKMNAELDKIIEERDSVECASTGKPIKELYGGAKYMAQLSNRGGGAKSTGGGGIEEGKKLERVSDRVKGALAVAKRGSKRELEEEEVLKLENKQ